MARVPLRIDPRLAWIVLTALTGCQADGTSVLSRWRMANDRSIAKGLPKLDEDDDRSMMARWLSPKAVKSSDPNAPPSLVLGPGGWNPTKVAPNPEADAEFRAAEALFQQGKLAEAEKAFAQTAKKRKDTPWGEKAQFYLAETRFQLGKYVAAHDSYEKLVATYPGTKYLEKLVAREYAIAQIWLKAGASETKPDDPKSKPDELTAKAVDRQSKPDELTAKAVDPKAKPDDPKAKPVETTAWYDRFNGKLPVLDVSGHATAVLEHVRHHDPTGPLADDAVLQLADFHFGVQDYEEAAIYYDQLISDHPKSPYLQRAQFASIDSKLKGYIGPEYDGAGLEQAREMVKQTLATFPERQASTGESLYHTLDLISDQQAERYFTVGSYYKRTNRVLSAEYYFALITHRFPNSPWASKAKKELTLLAKMPRKESLPSKILTAPGSVDPFSGGSNGSGAGGPNGGMGMGMPGAGGMGQGGGGSMY